MPPASPAAPAELVSSVAVVKLYCSFVASGWSPSSSPFCLNQERERFRVEKKKTKETEAKRREHRETYVVAEELLDHVVGQLVNFFVFVLLELLDLAEAVDLLDVDARLLEMVDLLGDE